MRSRGALNNQLSNCIANNPYVFNRAECVPTAAAPAETDIVASVTGFMIYNNYEKIHEDIDVGNGISLSAAGSTLTVKYNEDNSAVGTAKAAKIIPANNYSLHMVMEYGKALIFADGNIDVRG